MSYKGSILLLSSQQQDSAEPEQPSKIEKKKGLFYTIQAN